MKLRLTPAITGRDALLWASTPLLGWSHHSLNAGVAIAARAIARRTADRSRELHAGSVSPQIGTIFADTSKVYWDCARLFFSVVGRAMIGSAILPTTIKSGV